MLKVCLTHDIDRIDKTYQYFTKPFRALKQGNFRLFFKRLFTVFDKNPYWGFDYIIEIENKYNVKSTLFFLNESIAFRLLNLKTWKLSLGRYYVKDKRIVAILQFLDKHGWEIGLHGSYCSYDNLNLIKKEKEDLENILGHSIIGIRQHYLNLSENTWKFQAEAGFCYDSTWGLIKDIGFKDNKVRPFFPLPKKNFSVIPLNLMDFPFVNIKDKWIRFEEIAKNIDQQDGFLVINFHNNNFYESDFPGVKTIYNELIEKLKSRNAQFLTMQEAYYYTLKKRSDRDNSSCNLI